MTNATLTEESLAHFTGSDQWYRHITGCLFTDGVKHVADAGGAYWLVDEIAFRQNRFQAVAREAFQVWTLSVAGSTAMLTCEDGNGRKVHSFKIPFTDFPLPKIILWFTGNTILLPSEY